MIIRCLYTLTLAIASPFLLYSLYKKKPGKPSFGARWKEHFGVTPALPNAAAPIWIHAVSVGEALAATPIIKALKERHPEIPILVTTTTSTGAEQVEKLGDLVTHRYMPIDFSFAVRRFLRVTKPRNMLIMETELWPNTLYTVAQSGIPIQVLNARLSEKSLNNYQKIKPIFDLAAPHLSHVYCQYPKDAERFIKLGIEASKVSVTGSVKFDIHIADSVIHAAHQLREQLGEKRPVWIAASTHKGEDEKVLEAHQHILQALPNALLILVPRHPERFNNVYEQCTAAGFNTVRRTEPHTDYDDCQIYLGDTMGEMLLLLGAADVCFMGGSLIGDKVGGHNMLEPIALGVPVINGPSYFNFQEISEQLLNEGLMTLCHNSQELSQAIQNAFNQDNTADKNRMAAFMAKHQGSIQKTLQQI